MSNVEKGEIARIRPLRRTSGVVCDMNYIDLTKNMREYYRNKFLLYYKTANRKKRFQSHFKNRRSIKTLNNAKT